MIVSFLYLIEHEISKNVWFQGLFLDTVINPHEYHGSTLKIYRHQLRHRTFEKIKIKIKTQMGLYS